MIWTPNPRSRNTRDWHPHFALLPVTLADGRKAWLHRIERRLVGYHDFSMAPNWEYRA